jgi:25S rRNA (uracil2843-N3)-methyltransferase
MHDQDLLDLIATTFSSTLSSPSLPTDLQALKKHLFNPSFDEAFPTTLNTSQPEEEEKGCERSESNLEAYIVRWVPTRALCYSRIFKTIAGFLPDEKLHAVCIGAGCGSESLAFQTTVQSSCKKCRIGWD